MVNNLIIGQEFHSLIKELSPEKFQDYINNPDKSKIKKIVWDEKAQEITEKVINKRAEAEKYWNENQDEIINNNIPNFSDLTTEKQNRIRNNLKNNIINIFVWNYTKNLIMNEYIEKNLTNEIWYIIKWTEYNWKWNDYIDLYADINWIWDYDFSDKTLDWWKEAFIFIATEIAALVAGSLTMWAWAAWVNALVYWTRWVVYWTRLYKWIKWMQRTAELADKTLKWVKYTEKVWIIWARTSRYAAMTAIEWWTFYLGYWTTQSLIEWKNTFSKEWLYESMAFIWAFKALWGIYKIFWMELKPNISLKQQKLKLTSQLIIEWTTLSGMWLAFDWVIFEPWEWDAETIIQAFIMATLFKWVWRLTARKEWDKILLLENKIWKFKQDPNHLNFYKDWKWKYWTKKWDLWIQKEPKKTVTKNTEKKEKTETKSENEASLPKNITLEIQWKNWDQYEVTTNDTWSIIKVFNKTKNIEIKWWARSSWIKYNLENIRKKYWIETTETQTSSKQQTEENVKTKEEPTEKKETEKANKKTEVNQNISEIQKEIDWNFDKAIETELNKLKVNETINLAWNKIIKIEDNPIKKRFKVEFNWKEYKFWSLKETKDFINSNIKDNVTKLEIISKTEYKKHNKKLDKLHKKETKIVDGYKFTKEGEIINSKWEIIDFKKLPEKVKLKAVELTTWIKWMSNNIIKSTDNLNKLIKKLWGKESITTWEVCDTIYSKTIKKWKKFFETIWSENIIKKLWNLEPQWAKNFTEKDRSFLNPMKYVNWVYMFTKWLWKFIINWWPNKTFENLGKSNTKMEVLKTILTWERTNKEALIAFAAMWALPIWMNIHEKWFINALEWETFKDVLLNEHWRVFWPDTLNAINSFWPQSEFISNVTNSIKHWGQENVNNHPAVNNQKTTINQNQSQEI